MRALAAATERRKDVFPRGIRLAPEVLLSCSMQKNRTFLYPSESRARAIFISRWVRPPWSWDISASLTLL
jgi:hypothetical protein